MIAIVELVVRLASLYIVIGIVFALAFVIRGVMRIDHNAEGTSLAFRLAILPGCIALWPLLLARWRHAPATPEESNAHRDAARRGPGR